MDILWPFLIYTSVVLGVVIKRCGTMIVLRINPVPFVMAFTEVQKATHKLRKESGVLVSPEDVTVIATVEDKEPIFHSTPPLPLLVLLRRFNRKPVHLPLLPLLNSKKYLTNGVSSLPGLKCYFQGEMFSLPRKLLLNQFLLTR